ncbi:MAG: DUF3500 domain-containing protein [Desulfobacterales bacterium]|jgi:hypothetical protein
MPLNIRVCRYACLVAGLLLTMNVSAHDISAPSTAAGMHQSAEAFLKNLSPDQRQAALFSFEDRERFNWHYVPRGRAGLALKAMSDDQRRMALALMKIGLSADGFRKATDIMALEAVLREIETFNWLGRDPEKYFFSFFGQPSASGTWGWRVEGHHLSLNMTVVKGHLVATAPRFLGANPAAVTSGRLAGQRTLAREEDLARMLLRSLDGNQRRLAIFREQAYRDIVTGSDDKVVPLDPVGIPVTDLDASQTALVIELIGEFTQTMPAEIARPRMAAILKNGWEQVHFGWAGGLEPGQPHYYRIQGPSFLVEYDNVQNDANHIHTVWRDFAGDFGRDLLREHYRAAHD